MFDFLSQPFESSRIGDYLLEHLGDPRWASFHAAVAFVKQSGVRHIAAPMAAMLDRGATVKLSVGIDLHGTSLEGLTQLLEVLEGRGELWVFHNASRVTFHPKVYAFEGPEEIDLLVGSGNLTEGGLYTNYEAAFAARLRKGQDERAIASLQSTLNEWIDPATGLARRLDRDLLEGLRVTRMILPEAETRETEYGEHDSNSGYVRESGIFPSVPVRRAPASAKYPGTTPGGRSRLRPRGAPDVVRGFVMTLGTTDAGSGQTTPGTSRRSPEVFIPLAARDHDPDFWGFPDLFDEDTTKPGKFDRKDVTMRIGAAVVSVNMMTWPDKHDFRLRSEALRSAGNVGDILRIERVEGRSYEYDAQTLAAGTAEFEQYDLLCTNSVRNSPKRWGYY
jgi:HKD family nuclease